MSNGNSSIITEFLREALRDQYRIFGLYIHGVEVTQAIQHCNAADHLTDAADRGPDNSIRLVADKPAFVRVFVRSNREPISNVAGTVTLQKRRLGIWQDAGTLTQQWPATITAQVSPAYVTERGALAASLNFIIPAATMRGQILLKIHVESTGTIHKAETEVELDVSLLQTLRVRGIPVRYSGPDAAGNQIQLAAPTLADFQSAAVTALRLFPVSQTPDIGLAGIFTWSNPLTGNIVTDGVTSSCPQSWNDLLFWLGVAKVIDGNRTDRVYYAMLPNGIPIGGAGGCGGGGTVSAGFIGNGRTMAHEIGHVLGLSHAPGCLATGDMGDPNYPAYEPYDTVNNKQASIGEYGLDPTTQRLYSPNFTRDVMSYCSPFWISPYHYQALLQHSLLDPTWVSDGKGSRPPYYDEFFDDPIPHHIPDPPPPWVGRRVRRIAEPDPVPLFVVTGFLREDRFEVRSVLQIQTRPAWVGRQVPKTKIELLDEQGAVIERATVQSMMLHPGCECGGGGAIGGEPPVTVIQSLVPDPGRGAALRLTREGTELWSRRAPSEPPEIGRVSADIDGDQLHLFWQASASDEFPTERAARWSADEGRTWQSLAFGLQENETTVPLSVLTSGPILIQVLVSDGFHTTASEPVRVDVPPRAPEIAILWPTKGRTLRIDAGVRLLGIATASDGHTLPGESLRWELDGELVGTGTEVWANLPDWEGEHRVTLRVEDCHRTSEASVVFIATQTGQRPSQLCRD